MASIEEKFNAAVNVIRGLPKNGSYQPSSTMMLNFYSLFKQATYGPCNQKKPAFWDVIGRAKWEAWNALSNMTKQQAMELYVNELTKIIETMSFTENVAQFIGSFEELNNVKLDDLETVVPEIMKKAKSDPNSPFVSRTNSPQHGSIYTETNKDSKINQDDQIQNNSYLSQNCKIVDQSDDEYIDTFEDGVDVSISRLHDHLDLTKINLNRNCECSSQQQNPTMHQIFHIVNQMNNDLYNLNQKVCTIEQNINGIINRQTTRNMKWYSKLEWWPFINISPSWFIILILWPFIVKRLGKILQKPTTITR